MELYMLTPSPVMVKYAPKDAPQIGKGRWTLPLDLLKDKDFVNQIINRGIHLQQKLDNLPQDLRDRLQTTPQKLWATFKEEIKELGKQKAKEKNYRVDSQIKALRRDLDDLNNAPQVSANNNICRSESLLNYEIKYLENK
jgi:hypothetical protein